jgi:hypothetical protein
MNASIEKFEKSAEKKVKAFEKNIEKKLDAKSSL